MRRPAALALIVAFGVLATANSAGYRYGISDQAFYIPAIDLAENPALFPRDRELIEPQARLLLLDELLAAARNATGAELPSLFFLGYVATVALFAAAVLSIGGRLYRSAWTTAALLLALTLRHRITRTGVNTFEGYFHPRVLAFAVGLAAVALFWRARPVLAAVAAAVAMLVHPTTGSWFVVWLAAAAFVTAPAHRRKALAFALLAAASAAVIVVFASGRLERMDAAWMTAFAGRDYLFPHRDWGAGVWLVNLLPAAVLAEGARWRARLGLLHTREASIVSGAFVLLAAFLLSLPVVAAGVALAVQFQPSRMLWPIELLATAYLVWMLAEAPVRGSAARWRPVALAAVLAAAGAARGYYVLRIEHSNPLVRVSQPATDWWRMGEWIDRHTTLDAHVLADPQHVFPYGTSLRIVARRDVLTEDVKDAAIALYGRAVAARVVERRQALAAFHQLGEADLRALARRYDLDYLLVERPLDLPVVHRQGKLALYALDGEL